MEPEEMEDWLARTRSAVDQAIAASGEMARAVGAYYKELMEQGIPVEVVTQLVVNYQTMLLAQGMQGEGES